MKQIEQRCGELFEKGYGCAESVLMAIAEHQGIESPLIPRIAGGLCGGMARTGGMCGAVSGAILALNLVYGRDTVEGDREANYAAVQQLVSRFESEFGSVNCTGLLGCDLGTDAGRAAYQAQGLGSRCRLYSESAAQMALQIIQSA